MAVRSAFQVKTWCLWKRTILPCVSLSHKHIHRCACAHTGAHASHADPGIHISSSPGPGSEPGGQQLRHPQKIKHSSVLLAQETYQKQILLIPTDKDCFVVLWCSQALGVAIQVKKGCGIEDAVNLVKGENRKGHQFSGQWPHSHESPNLRPGEPLQMSSQRILHSTSISSAFTEKAPWARQWLPTYKDKYGADSPQSLLFWGEPCREEKQNYP